MSQNFNKLLGSSIIKNDRETINENFDAIRSAHSGTSFPSKELVAGMEFFNTSTKKLYRLQPDLSTWTLELDLSSGTAVVAKASSADAANKASKDANGKDISTYVAKLESDVNNAFCINVYDGNDNKLGSVTIPETKAEIMTGASSSSAGEAGLVPQPKAGDNDKFLCGDGSFKEAGKVKSVNGKTGDVVVGEVKDFSISGMTVTVTFADDSTKKLTTQDTNTPFMPNYSAGVNVASNSLLNGYTAPSNGVLYFAGIPYGTTARKVLINNTEVGVFRYAVGYSLAPVPYLLTKGDVFKVTSLDTDENTLWSAKFFPVKAV